VEIESARTASGLSRDKGEGSRDCFSQAQNSIRSNHDLAVNQGKGQGKHPVHSVCEPR